MPKKTEIKTKPTEMSVDVFIGNITDETKRNDCIEIMKMMTAATKEEPRVWGQAMIGFGERTIESPNTGRTVDWFSMGFAPRKANLSLYLTGGIKAWSDDLAKLGKHKTGVGCLYINKLSDVDLNVLKMMIEKSAKGKW